MFLLLMVLTVAIVASAEPANPIPITVVYNLLLGS